ncbi:MAG: hypothetical protein IKX34_03520 [Bacteroidales bacterium]|nr:hypothetical protein [Bacteroidales bacterium]
MDRFSLLRISAVLFLSLFLSSACFMDWAPIVVSVAVQDRDGNDRLNPGNASSFIVK